MDIRLTVALRCDARSVPAVRRLLRSSLNGLGVLREVVADIEVALTEACTNVLKHAGVGDAYEVSACIQGDLCVIEVVDTGGGFEFDATGRGDAPAHAESGRGIQLIRALVDRVEFIPRAQGTAVHLEKKLAWSTESVGLEQGERPRSPARARLPPTLRRADARDAHPGPVASA